MRTVERLSLLVAGATAFFAVGDIILLADSTVSIAPQTWIQFARTVAALVAIYVAAWVVKRRMDRKSDRIAAFIRNAADGLMVIVYAGGLFTPLSLTGGIFMYVAAAQGLPLMDAELAAIDRTIGFAWPSFLEAANNAPIIPTVLLFAYHTTGPQIPVLFLFLGMTLRRERLVEFVAQLGVSSTLTGILMAAVPAAGAYAYFRPSLEMFNHFTSRAGMWHFEELMRLRSGQPFLYDVSRTQGLVTFPSYHTVLAVITSYAVRRIRYVGIPVAVLNAIVIVSTIPEGGHYLIDVLAGLAIALVSIVFVGAVGGMRRGDEQTTSGGVGASEQ